MESDELIRSAGYKYGSGYTRKWKRRFESSSALAFLEESFDLNVQRLRQLRNTFVNEMRRGLKRVGSTIKMIPSCVALLTLIPHAVLTHHVYSCAFADLARSLLRPSPPAASFVTTLPTGKERGEVWAMDLGGTNCRVARYPLLGDGVVGEPVETHFEVPAEVCSVLSRRGGFVRWCARSHRIAIARLCSFVLQVKGGVSDQLMDWLVTLVEKADVPDGATMGFTFSFPVDQTAIDAGTLMHWTKGWTTRGVPGQDVMALLRERLQRRVRHALCRPLSPVHRPVDASLHPVWVAC